MPASAFQKLAAVPEPIRGKGRRSTAAMDAILAHVFLCNISGARVSFNDLLESGLFGAPSTLGRRVRSMLNSGLLRADYGTNAHTEPLRVATDGWERLELRNRQIDRFLEAQAPAVETPKPPAASRVADHDSKKARQVGLPLSRSMFRASYLSRSLTDNQGLQDIIRAARENNRLLRVTGVLLCHGDHFIQIIEGPQRAVSQLLIRIASDTRHTDFTLLQSGFVRGRRFGEWRMGLLPVGDERRFFSMMQILADRDFEAEYDFYSEVLSELEARPGRSRLL